MARSSGLLKIAFLCSGILISTLTSGQGLFSRQNVINQYTTVGIGGGSSHYFGDLSPYRYFYNSLYTNVRWNANAHYTRYLTPNTALRVQLSWIRVLGDDFTYSQRNLDEFYQFFIRNLHFRNDVKEFTLSGIFNLLPSYGKGGSRTRLNFTPYAHIGLGLIAHSPFTTAPFGSPNAGSWVPLRNASTSGQIIPGYGLKMYSYVSPVLPIGLGLRFKVNDKIDITFEGNLRLTRTDYLDDVATVPYPDEAQLVSFIGNDGQLSYRADEVIHSRTNTNRIPILDQIWDTPNNFGPGIKGPNYPVTEIQAHYGPTSANNTLRGTSNTMDAYATTQITISFVISNKIKCPVLK
ncbi:hypothetical protein [Jiulongibacter sediminis]|jgi:hypothetical protein|uniref:hypothetical protein n=1 Tax=Jiulongibacter sediminis TaxID=1605367 RepID=UPI0026F2B772|nr:hypothetical protein [Jiulongibacter sediminis]